MGSLLALGAFAFVAAWAFDDEGRWWLTGVGILCWICAIVGYA